jgi:hypothetical protein
MDAAGVYMHVSKDFKDAFDKALLAHGFRLGANGDRTVDVVVHEFFIRESNGWTEITDRGSSVIHVTVKNKHGDALFSNDFHVVMKKTPEVVLFKNAGIDNAGRHAASSQFLADVVNRIISDRGFLNSLLKKNIDSGVDVPQLNK